MIRPGLSLSPVRKAALKPPRGRESSFKDQGAVHLPGMYPEIQRNTVIDPRRAFGHPVIVGTAELTNQSSSCYWPAGQITPRSTRKSLRSRSIKISSGCVVVKKT